MSEKIPVDFSQLKKTVGENRTLFLKLGNNALQEYPAKIAEIRAALAQRDAAAVARIAHALKGSFAGIGAEEARGVAYAVELKGKDNALTEAAPMVEELAAAVGRLCDFFSSPAWIERV
ncbi:MAG: Hpt domain-containing protein [Thermodesulfobacteriota bacterium]